MKLSERLGPLMQVQAAQQLPTILMPFVDWSPDMTMLGSAGLSEARNVIPDVDGYRPFFSPVRRPQALPALCQAAIGVRNAAGDGYTYAGTATRLYELRGGAFVDESRDGADYLTGPGETWEMIEYGDKVIATNFSDHAQFITIGGGASGAFDDLFTSAAKPKARHIDVVGEFVVMGNTFDGVDGTRPSRVWWTAINNARDADPSEATQCSFQDLADGGFVQRIVGTQTYGLIFQERMIRRMQYVGSPLIFQIYPIDNRRGTPIPRSVVALGSVVYFISEEGFFACDGAQSVPIGFGKVDKTFWRLFNASASALVSTAVDRVNRVVMWAFPVAGGGNSATEIFCYHVPTQKWSRATVTIETFVGFREGGLTLEQLDTIGTNVDAWPGLPWDSEEYKGGAYRLAIFDGTHSVATFAGPPLPATMATADYEPVPSARALVQEVWPIIDAPEIRVQHGVRDNFTVQPRYTTPRVVDRIGKANVLVEGRFHRTLVSIPNGAAWTLAQAVRVEASRTGKY